MQWVFVAASGQQFTCQESDVAALRQAGHITPQTLVWREGMTEWTSAAAAFPSAFAANDPGGVTQPMSSNPPPTAAGSAGFAAAPAPVAPDGPHGNPAPTALATPTAATPATAQGPPTLSASGFAAARVSTSSAPMVRSDISVVRQISRPLLDRRGWIRFYAVILILVGVLTILPLGWLLVWAGVSLWKALGEIDSAQANGDAEALAGAQARIGRHFVLVATMWLLGVLAIIVAVALFSTVLYAQLRELSLKPDTNDENGQLPTELIRRAPDPSGGERNN